MASIRFGKKQFRVVLICLLLFLLFAAILFGVSKFQKSRTAPAEMGEQNSSQPLTYVDGSAYRLKENIESILLIGVDKTSDAETYQEYVNTQQSDFLLLLVLDKSTNICTALPLNRDTMTEVWKLDVQGKPSTSRVEQLCLAHTYGSGGEDSCENTVRAVENLLFGQKIDHYVAITMDAVPVLADLVGGVTVEIDEDMTAIDEHLVAGTTVTLEGDLALAYVRARRSVSDGTNQSRMARQERFLRAFWQTWQEKEAAGEDLSADALMALSNEMLSDCTVQRLNTLTQSIEKSTLAVLPASEGEGTIKDGFAEFYVDDHALHKTVLQLFYDMVEE